MNLTEMIVELRAERENVEQAILVLERIAAGQGKRRGRPHHHALPDERCRSTVG